MNNTSNDDVHIPSYDEQCESNTRYWLRNLPCKLVMMLRRTPPKTGEQFQSVWFTVPVRQTRKYRHTFPLWFGRRHFVVYQNYSLWLPEPIKIYSFDILTHWMQHQNCADANYRITLTTNERVLFLVISNFQVRSVFKLLVDFIYSIIVYQDKKCHGALQGLYENYRH